MIGITPLCSFRERLFSCLYRNLAELLESLLELKRSLTCTSTSGLVSFEVLVCVLSEHCPSCVELFYQFFHCFVFLMVCYRFIRPSSA